MFESLSPLTIDILQSLLYAVIIFTALMVAALILVYLERKVAGHMQSRFGPMHVGPHGLLQSLADAIKLLTKQPQFPKNADKIVFILAPILITLTVLLAFVAIPFDETTIIADLDVGIIYILALSSLVVVSLVSAAYGSSNKYSFLGAMRSAAQMLSYEVPILFSIAGVLILSESARMTAIVEAQSGLWFIILQPIGFLIYFISAVAETNRTPFDLPEAESELVAGYHTEYSGMQFALFFAAEYANIVLVSAIATVLFLGGGTGPLLPGAVWFLIKTFIFVLLIFSFRWTFPRLRIDQVISFCWKFLVPLALINLSLTAIFKVIF